MEKSEELIIKQNVNEQKQQKKNKVPVDETKETELEREYNNSIEAFDKSYENILPSLINTTWINDNPNHKISFYNDVGCFSNASSIMSMNNLRTWYEGAAMMSEWSDNHIQGAQFNLLLSNSEMITVIVNSNNNDQRNETLTFIETKHETKLQCHNAQKENADNPINCENQKGSSHCEL